jgi:hypothetical protein
MHAIIWEGYVTQNAANGWPGAPAKEIWDGAGVFRDITGAVPAATAEISEAVPGNRRWELLMLSAALTTSAVAGVRNAGYSIDDSANILFLARSSLGQNPSTTVRYNFTPGQPFYNDTLNTVIIPGPTITTLRNSFRFRSSTAGMQAGDQWSAPQYTILEWGSWEA